MKRYLTIALLTLTIGAFSAEYYGSCGRCGHPVSKSGKCTNQTCEQYGPRKD